jgi:ribosomal protein S27AE
MRVSSTFPNFTPHRATSLLPATLLDADAPRCSSAIMPRSRKINRENVLASLDKVCPKCGKPIPPAEVRRIDFERIECPVCGERFVSTPTES